MRYCPPFIFAHRCFVTRAENEISTKLIEEKFGNGGPMPALDSRWMVGKQRIDDLVKWGIDKECYGTYYGFRNRDDQMLFYMLFEGQMRKT
jgi:hypothetical protein